MYRGSHLTPRHFTAALKPSGSCMAPAATSFARGGWPRTTVRDPCKTLLRPEFRKVDPDSMRTMADAQSAISRHSSRIRADSYNHCSETCKCTHARLLSCACRPASAWLVPLLISRALELNSREFQTGLRHHLSLTELPLNAPVKLFSGYFPIVSWYRT
jgi:hypothetical protein